ncbi:hypothetical protein LEP1GSC041_2002 [Leptospira noguchii str. 2006001870]|nr:hypothetical protein LEP1GSC041_2002 [Leptospira noguchii str. 2006001870]EMI69863.1 hypothetical protein LEP1GSC072_0383 [Leptospira noguchii str. Bonito]
MSYCWNFMKLQNKNGYSLLAEFFLKEKTKKQKSLEMILFLW